MKVQWSLHSSSNHHLIPVIITRKHAPLRNVQRLLNPQPYIPVNPASAVPPGIWLVGIVYPHRKDIVSVPVDVWSQIVGKGYISVRPRAEFNPVQPHCRIHIHSVKVDMDNLAAKLVVHFEMLAVPTYAAGKRTSACSGRIPGIEVALNCPVVRKFETSPRRIVKA